MRMPTMAESWKPHQPYGTASVTSQSRLVSRMMNIVKLKARQLMTGIAAGSSAAEGPRATITRKVKYPGNPGSRTNIHR